EQRSSRDAQYLFINRRFVRDQLIGRALSEAYRAMMPSGTYPAAVLFIEVLPTEVDVNVHPAKTEVRFLHEGAVLAFVRDAVAKALRATHPITQVPGMVRDDEQMSGGAQSPAERSVYRSTYGSADGRRTEIDTVAHQANRDADAMSSQTERTEIAGLARSETRAAGEAVFFESESASALEVSDEPGCSAHSMTASLGGEGASIGASMLPGLGHGIKPLGQDRK